MNYLKNRIFIVFDLAYPLTIYHDKIKNWNSAKKFSGSISVLFFPLFAP